MSFWSKSLSILLAVGSNRHVRRQTTQAPTVCEKVCDDAEIVAQFNGKTPALCETGGQFETSLADCTACIQANSSTTNVTTIPQLDQFINYCDSLNPGIASAQSIISSASSQEAALSRSSASLASVQASAESVLGITSSFFTSRTTTSLTSPSSSTNATTRAVQTSSRAVQTFSPTPLPASTSNTKTIIGAAVGGSIGGILIVAVIAGIFIKRRRKQRKVTATDTQPPDKAQLHSDDYKPPREELLGTLGKIQYDHTKLSELPSNEPVEKTKELPANEEVGAELDNKVRLPKPEGSSQSTKVGSGPMDENARP